MARRAQGISLPVYDLTVSSAAKKDTRHFPKRIQRQIADAILGLAVDPRPDGVEKMTGSKTYWKIVVAKDYRVIYRVDDKAKEVTVRVVGDRKEVYDLYKRRVLGR